MLTGACQDSRIEPPSATAGTGSAEQGVSTPIRVRPGFVRGWCLIAGIVRSLRGRNHTSHNHAAGRLLLCAAALVLSATVASGQWLETKITLPDSLGGATYPTCLTTDTSERYVYIGDQSGAVYVVDAVARVRVAKLPCLAVALCTDTRRNKVYAADCVGNQVFAISATNHQIVATIPTGAYPLALCYNSTGDKVYSADTAGHDLTVIDCSSDSVIKTIHLGESPAELCYNPASNRIFCRTALRWEEGNELLVIDGAADSVVAVHPDTWSSLMLAAAAVNKVYASNRSGLNALDGTTGAILNTHDVSADPMCFNGVHRSCTPVTRTGVRCGSLIAPPIRKSAGSGCSLGISTPWPAKQLPAESTSRATILGICWK